MGSKGSQQKTEQTSTATSAPNAQAGALYGDILNQLQGYVQQNPNAPVYQGQQVAQFTPDQQTAMNTVNQAQGAYQPYLQQAGQFAQQAGSAITPGQISAAMSPYQQQVIDTTMAQMDQRNAQQMSSLKGTEAQQGAFGGSRAAVTEATLGGQQNMNAASTLAGLNSQNYSQAVTQAQGNRAAAGTGAQLESGLGTQSMQLPFMGAQAQLQTGAQQQQLAQQNLNVPYQQWLQQQSWTPQMLQFEAGLGTGVGSQMGGTSTNAGTTTTTPAQPNPWTQIAGGALAVGLAPFTGGASLAALPAIAAKSASGGRINKADGGSVGSDIVGNAVRMARQMREGMAGGGVPGAGVGTAEYMGHSIPAIIPSMQITGGKGAPSTPGFVSSPEMKNPNSDMKGLGAGLGALAKAGYDKWNEPTTPTGYTGNTTDPFAGQPDATTSYMGGIPYPMFKKSLGGTVSPESAYHGFAHRAYGGDVVFDPTPISEQGGEDPNKAPVMPAEGFTDQPPSIVPAGEFKPYEAPPQADVPMPRPRPESLRVDDLAAAPMPIGVDGTASAPVAPPTGGIFTRLLRTESNGRQLDENGNPLTSPKGATGIAQIMPTTGPEAAKLAGLPWDEQKFKYDANYNATLGKAYFDHQTKVFGGDPEKGAAAYNAGPGRLREAMAMAAAHGGSYKDYLPDETQSYLGKVFGQQQDDAELPPNARPTAYTGGVNEPISQDVSNQYAPGVGPRGDEGGDRTNPAIDVAAQAIVPKNDDPRKLPQNLSILERVLGKEFDPATRQAIMAAGLRMMTTPGNIGTVLGTAGMQGMATYSEAKQMEQAQDEARRKQAFEREKFERPYSELTAVQRATAAHQEATELKEKWKLVEGDGMGTPDRIFNETTGEFRNVPPNTTSAQAVNAANGNAYQYGINAPSLKKEDPVPEPEQLPGYSSASIKSGAEQFLINGSLPRASVNAKTKQGQQDSNYRRAIQNYAIALGQSRGLTESDIADIRVFGPQAARFPLSKQGDQTVALGTAIRHTDSLRKYAEAWKLSKGSDSPLLRQASAAFAKTWGSAEPTNLEAAARISAPEIIKAISVAGGGTGEERIAQQNGFKPGASDAQIVGAIDVAQEYLAGQLPAKEAQANEVHFPHQKFIRMVGENEYKILEKLRSQAAAPSAAGSSVTNPAAPPAAGSSADIVPPSLKGRNLQGNGKGFFRDKTTGEVFDKFGKPINPTKLLGENNG